MWSIMGAASASWSFNIVTIDWAVVDKQVKLWKFLTDALVMEYHSSGESRSFPQTVRDMLPVLSAIKKDLRRILSWFRVYVSCSSLIEPNFTVTLTCNSKQNVSHFPRNSMNIPHHFVNGLTIRFIHLDGSHKMQL